MNSNPVTLAKMPGLLVAACVFLFGSLSLVLPSGYSYGPLLLLLIALVYLFIRPYPPLIREDKYLLVALLGYFALGTANNLIHHLPSHSYDNFARFLLAVPVLLLLLRLRVPPLFFWLGISLGALGGGLLAGWNFWLQGSERAEGFNNAIQFGDMAMLFACLLLAGLCSARQAPLWLRLVMLLGIAGGLLASLLSGARGGWLALPLALLLLYVLLRRHISLRNKRLLFAGCGLLLLSLYGLLQTAVVHERLAAGWQDLQTLQAPNRANTSIGSRWQMWHTSLAMIAERPVLGWGELQNYRNSQGQAEPLFTRYNHVHNDLLDALAKRGIMGGLGLLALYLVPALCFYRRARAPEANMSEPSASALAGLLLVASSAVFGLTQSFFSHSSGVMIYVFLLVILWAQLRHEASSPKGS